MPGNPRADARLNQAFEVSAKLGKSLEIRSNPNTRQMIIGIDILLHPLPIEQTISLKSTAKQNTAYELLYSFFICNSKEKTQTKEFLHKVYNEGITSHVEV